MTAITCAEILFMGLVLLLGCLAFEKRQLALAREKIPVRIHVNGTRGKSSTTRLIAGALREQFPTIAKTTGTLPRLIGSNGEESPIDRAGPPNISEQIRTIIRCSKLNPKALILECMALRPEYQAISEESIIQASIAVITNIRPDHLDVMGPTVEDVGLALAGMIPRGGLLITAEQTLLGLLRKACELKSARLIAVSARDVQNIPLAAMAKFSYFEHRENVALALAVAKELGVSESAALAGMLRAAPDPGALCALLLPNKSRASAWLFVNAFAANDPASNRQIAELAWRAFPKFKKTAILLNLRADRSDRSIQMAEMLLSWPEVSQVILMGSGAALAAAVLKRSGFPEHQVLNLGAISAQLAGQYLLEKVKTGTAVIGMGNIGEAGMELVEILKAEGNALSGSAFYPIPKRQQNPQLAQTQEIAYV